MAVNFCSNCGAKLRAGAKFCGYCGQKIYSEEKKLPPMPYEKSKSVMEIYAEKKAQNTAKTELQKSVPPKSVAEIFAETKKNAQAKPVAKSSLPPKPVSNPPPRPTYTPPKNLTPPFAPVYHEDATIKEKFFSTKDRLNSREYFTRSLIAVGGFVILFILGLLADSRVGESFGAIIGLGGLLLFIVAEYCLSVRRLKDTKYESSAEVLAILVILLEPLSSFALLCIPSKDG